MCNCSTRVKYIFICTIADVVQVCSGLAWDSRLRLVVDMLGDIAMQLDRQVTYTVFEILIEHDLTSLA